MTYTTLSIGLSYNQQTGEHWWKVDIGGTLLEGENIFDAAEKAKLNAMKIVQSDNSMKGTIIKPAMDEGQRDALIKELEEATDIPTLNIIIRETPSVILNDEKFRDAHIKTLQRLSAVK